MLLKFLGVYLIIDCKQKFHLEYQNRLQNKNIIWCSQKWCNKIKDINISIIGTEYYIFNSSE